MDPITLIAGGALGLGIGTMIGAYLRHEKHFIPPEEQKDIWTHLQETSQTRAELSAKKRALIEMYNDGKLSENAYITKDAHYTELLGEADDTIDRLVKKLAQVYLGEEEKKSDERLGQIKNIVELNKQIKELRIKDEELRADNARLHMQLNENEEEKKELLAKKNYLEKKTEEERKVRKALREKAEQRKKERAPETVTEMQITNLNKENKLLRTSLGRNKNSVMRLSRELGVLEAIMERYASVIEQGEQKTAGDLKGLVNPSDSVVKRMVVKYSTPEKVYEFVRDKIEEVYVPFMFWLNPADVIQLKAGDSQDRATLLCTMLRAMGEDAKVLVVELKNGVHRSLVVTKGRVLALDPVREFEDFKGAEDKVLAMYSFDGSGFKKKVYEFNEKEYKAF